MSAAPFPMPLSDFEYYMLMDDRPTYPMILSLVVHVSGTLDRAQFVSAVSAALRVHPLLNCRVQKLRRLGWCWTANQSETPNIVWSHQDADLPTEDQPIASINLRHETGLRVIVTASTDRARVDFQFHHACCDGAGSVEFLGEVFARYGLATVTADAETPKVGSVKLSQLLKRDRFSTTNSDEVRPSRSLWQLFGNARRFLFWRTTPILPKQKTDKKTAESGTGSRMITEVLPKEVARQLRNAAQILSASVNDICISEMLRLIRDWNRAAGDRSSKRSIRVVMPVSLRTADHDQMPAANLVSYTFVNRTFSDCDDPVQLLSTIQNQTAEMLHRQDGFVFLNCLRFVRRVPGLLSMLLRTKSCFGSVVLAYVGDVRRLFSGQFPLDDGKWVAGNVTIERIDGVAPIRANTRAAISIGTYAGEMILNLRTDRTTLSHDDSKVFLKQFAVRLERVAMTGLLSKESKPSCLEPVSVQKV